LFCCIYKTAQLVCCFTECTLKTFLVATVKTLSAIKGLGKEKNFSSMDYLLTSPSSLRFSDFISSIPKETDHKWLRFSVNLGDARRSTRTRITCGAISSRRKLAERESAERENRVLVRSLMSRISDREPLVKTLDKYVKVVRCDHCFLLFEELGKSDKWLQCLEVVLIWSFSFCVLLEDFGLFL